MATPMSVLLGLDRLGHSSTKKHVASESCKWKLLAQHPFNEQLPEGVWVCLHPPDRSGTIDALKEGR